MLKIWSEFVSRCFLVPIDSLKPSILFEGGGGGGWGESLVIESSWRSVDFDMLFHFLSFQRIHFASKIPVFSSDHLSIRQSMVWHDNKPKEKNMLILAKWKWRPLYFWRILDFWWFVAGVERLSFHEWNGISHQFLNFTEVHFEGPSKCMSFAASNAFKSWYFHDFLPTS